MAQDDIETAAPADIFVDAQGKLWRCIAFCSMPTVTFEEVEGKTPDPPNHFAQQAAQCVTQTPQRTPIIKERKTGGVGGLMWEGWKRIYRATGQSS